MEINLVLATGLAYSFLGAVILFVSHRALYQRATQIVAGYPRVLAILRIQRHDGVLGLIVLMSGTVLQGFAALGYNASIAHWRYPIWIIAGSLLAYCLWRLGVSYRADRARARPAASRQAAKQRYETRRSIRLIEAARREAANRHACELASGPRDRSVVYLAQEWECRWWSDKLGVTPFALSAAVRQVGPMVADIERYFGMSSRKRYAIAA